MPLNHVISEEHIVLTERRKLRKERKSLFHNTEENDRR